MEKLQKGQCVFLGDSGACSWIEKISKDMDKYTLPTQLTNIRQGKISKLKNIPENNITKSIHVQYPTRIDYKKFLRLWNVGPTL